MTDEPIDQRQAKIDALTAEFRAAQQRRQVKLGMALWNRTEAERRDAVVPADPPAKPFEH